MGKWFPKVYDIMMQPLERRTFYNIRRNLLQKAEGTVLEIGSGTGINFAFYERQHKVVTIEPNPQMQEQSLLRAASARVPIEVISGSAERLPFPNDSFDSVVGTLVLCSIPDPTKALAEIRRVCKTGGRILLFEHVRMHQPVFSRLQDWLTPMWKRLCDGCHLNRDTLQLIRSSGFEIISVEGYAKNLFLTIEARK